MIQLSFARLNVPAALTILGIALSPAAANAADTPISFIERATSDAVTDLGATGDSVGDVLTFNNEVYDPANTKLVGHDNGWCIRTVKGEAWECFWTIMLDDGQITVEGPYFDTKDSVLAVTGGTGAYAGKGGEMKLHSRNDKGTEYDFIYTLTP